jgi:hypothetical protein
MQMNHPDRYAGNDRLRQHAEEQCKLINEARDVLLSESWQSDHNETGHSDRNRRDAYGAHDSGGQYGSRQNPAWGEGGHGDRGSGSRQQTAPSSSGGKLSVTPVLDIWKTSVGYSVLGVLVLPVLFAVDGIITGPAAWVFEIMRHVCIVSQLIYAVAIYPSLFDRKPRLKSSAVISFWNCAVGGFVFGPIWNGNLSKKVKGVSNIVFAVLVGLLLASWLFLYGYLAAVVQWL